MPRKPRIHYEGAFYHVILRGNAKQEIFSDAKDRHRFFEFVQDAVERFGFRLHGYCLMTNHVHLAIQVGGIPLSRIMQNLSLRYTKWVNWRKNSIGHVFQGRYKSVMIEADNYLAQLVAYLHLNPIRARIVKAPEDYPWSSHRAYIGLEQAPWLTTQFVLSQFSKQENKARSAFREFVCARCGEGHKPEFHGVTTVDSRVFGDDDFVEEALRNEPSAMATATMNDVLDAVTKLYGVTMEEIVSPGQGRRISQARALAAWGVFTLSSATLTELARKFERDVTSLSSAIKRLVERSKRDEAISVKMDTLGKAVAKFASLQA
jgi:putative transposase